MYGFAVLSAAMIGCFFAAVAFYFVTHDEGFIRQAGPYSLISAVAMGSAIGSLGFYLEKVEEADQSSMMSP